MKVEVLKGDSHNSGKFIGLDGRVIIIKKGRYILDDLSHPLLSEKECYFRKIYCLEYKKRKIYFLNLYGNTETIIGIHIGLTKWQHNRFLWMQNRHWLQKEENVRYLVNLLFLVLGAYLGIKNLN